MRRLARLLALGLAITLVGACSGSKKSNDTGAGADALSDFLLPSQLPLGFQIAHGTIVRQGSATQSFAAAVGRAGGSGAYASVLQVLATTASADRIVSPIEKPTAVDINGMQARLTDNPFAGAVVDWFAHGLLISVIGPPGSSAVATDLARRIQLPAGTDVGTVALGSAPDGYTVIESAHFEGHAPEEGTQLELDGALGTTIVVGVTHTTAPLELALGTIEHMTPMTVRGHAALVGVITRELTPGRGVTQTTIAWYDHPGQLVTIAGATPVDQLQPVANSLRHVSETEWRLALPVVTTTVPTATRP